MDIMNEESENKPFGGLWACLINAKISYKQYCIETKRVACDLNKSFLFSLADDAYIWIVSSIVDFLDMPLISMESLSTYDDLIKRDKDIKTNRNKSILLPIDYEALVTDYGVDAIQVILGKFSKYDKTNLSYALSDWVCDALLVLNKNVIIPYTGTMNSF